MSIHLRQLSHSVKTSRVKSYYPTTFKREQTHSPVSFHSDLLKMVKLTSWLTDLLSRINSEVNRLSSILMTTFLPGSFSLTTLHTSFNNFSSSLGLLEFPSIPFDEVGSLVSLTKVKSNYFLPFIYSLILSRIYYRFKGKVGRSVLFEEQVRYNFTKKITFQNMKYTKF